METNYSQALQARKIIENNLLAIGIVDDGRITVEDLEEMETYDPSSEENRIALDIGDLVKLVHPSIYTAELLDMKEHEFQEFFRKAEEAEIATVFDVDEDDPRWIGIIWGDRLEAFNIHRKTLKVVCYDEDDEDE